MKKKNWGWAAYIAILAAFVTIFKARIGDLDFSGLLLLIGLIIAVPVLSICTLAFYCRRKQ